jgi:hypothetical protein
MAKFHELSNELLLQIFDSPDLSFLDLVCISKTCYRWRLIITNCRPSNERLFLRSPAGSPPHGQGQVTSTEITMDARLRRTPNTIWNEYDGATWQLALSWDKDEATLPPPHNPILVEVAETILRPSPIFSYALPYAGCGIHTPPSANEQPIITFCDLEELRHKTRLLEEPPAYEEFTTVTIIQRLLHNNPLRRFLLWCFGSTEDEYPLPPVSKRNTLITQHPLTQIDVTCRCVIRYCAHSCGRVVKFTYRCARHGGSLLMLGDFEGIVRLLLANLWRMFQEQGRDIELGHGVKWLLYE